MDELGLFTAALGLSGPWRVIRTEFDAEADPVGSVSGFRSWCPVRLPGQGLRRTVGVRCMTPRTRRGGIWTSSSTRRCLHARLPRVRCPEHGVRQVSVPWARPGSGFTLLFEALVLSFAEAMPMAKVAQMTREHDTRIWRVRGAPRATPPATSRTARR